MVSNATQKADLVSPGSAKLLSKQRPRWPRVAGGSRARALPSDISDLFIVLDNSHKDAEWGPMGATPSLVCAARWTLIDPFTGLAHRGDRGLEMLSKFLWTTQPVTAELGCQIQLIFHELVNQPLPAWVFLSVKRRLKSDLYFIKFSFGLNEKMDGRCLAPDLLHTRQSKNDSLLLQSHFQGRVQERNFLEMYGSGHLRRALRFGEELVTLQDGSFHVATKTFR